MSSTAISGSLRNPTDSVCAARFNEALFASRLRPEGFEPPTDGLEIRCSIQLSYGRLYDFRRVLRALMIRGMSCDDRCQLMTTKTTNGSQPKTKDFPLTTTANRRWAKKIEGMLHDFGVLSDLEAALAKYLDRKDDLQAGRTPKRAGDERLRLERLSIGQISKKPLVVGCWLKSIRQDGCGRFGSCVPKKQATPAF
jgi:hypothetical protein